MPRALVREVRGRIGPDGVELEPLDEADVVAAARALQDAGVDIAVVGLIHSYRNPAHEQQARDIVGGTDCGCAWSFPARSGRRRASTSAAC